MFVYLKYYYILYNLIFNTIFKMKNSVFEWK